MNYETLQEIEMAHTPGRLATDCADHDEPHQNIQLQIGNRTVATVWIDDAPVHDFNAEQTANARRLVACWNACDGLYTESLERGMPLAEQIVDALNQRDSLREVNAELLAALERFASWADSQADAQSKGGHATFDLMALREERDSARATIARATAQANTEAMRHAAKD